MDWRDFPGAPPTGTIIPKKGNEIADGTVRCTSIGDFNILLARSGEKLHGYINACPHQYLPLDHRSDKIVSACRTRLRCSNHGAEFDLTTGSGCGGYGLGSSLIQIPITETDNTIIIRG